MSVSRAFHGVIPAMAIPFRDDYKIDEEGLARFARWLAAREGVTAVMTNGHTGEVGSLLPEERAEVTRIVGIFRSALVRPPVRPPSAEDVAAMAAALEASGVSRVELV